MSAKKKTPNTSGNTLFNYFARSPTTPKADKPRPATASPLAVKPNTPTSSKKGGTGKANSNWHKKLHV